MEEMLDVGAGAAGEAELRPDPSLVTRIWNRDPSAWAPGEDDPAERLGWLDLPTGMQPEVDGIETFAAAVRSDGISTVVLLGMGGSSLAPEVFARTFGSEESNHPSLIVLDSTHPDQIRAVSERLDLGATLFIVSSKSGGTIETISLYRYFRALLDDGSKFVAITDADTSLEQLARAEGFRTVFRNRPDIGGRYSALSHFGLVPAALAGAPIRQLLESAAAMAAECREPTHTNPGLALGYAIGEPARRGKDKLTFSISDGIASFGAWVEQLIAESTGKEGRGIVPIVDEPAPGEVSYGSDRIFVEMRLPDGGPARPEGSRVPDSPMIEIETSSARGLGAEMFRWEFATAVAGSILGINAFDQPNVEAAKRVTRELLDSKEKIEWAEDDPSAVFDGAAPPDLACLLAFAPSSAGNHEILEAGRRRVLLEHGVATMSGFGPRYLHSTGQLHKGGKKNVRALVILDPPEQDAPIPGSPHTFGQLISAQAAGDAQALRDAGQQVARTTWAKFAEWAT